MEYDIRPHEAYDEAALPSHRVMLVVTVLVLSWSDMDEEDTTTVELVVKAA